MDSSLFSAISVIITQIGVGNFLLVILALFAVTNLPSIIDKIINRKAHNQREKQHASDMTFLRTQITNIWDEVGKTASKIDDFNKVISIQNRSVENYSKVAADQNQQRVAENIAITENIINIADSIDSIEKMMRNVMSEKDAMGLVSLKMGSVLDFKTRLESKILDILTSGKTNGQLEKNVKNIIGAEWLDLKSELGAFSFPFNIRNFLDKFEQDLWNEAGLFNIIKNMAINSDKDMDMKMSAIGRQLDIGTRDILACLATYIEENKNTHGVTK